MSVTDETELHARQFFAGHEISLRQWVLGPAPEEMTDVRILEIAPGPRLPEPIYLTAGAWRGALRPLEFLIIGQGHRDAYVELLTMIAWYARTHSLGLGHSVSIGKPLVDGSACEYVYLTLPYLFGPELEIVPTREGERQILWTFPITAQEKGFLNAEGLDALEQRFESAEVEYWSPTRRSVV